MIRSITTIYPVILPVSATDQELKGRDKVKALSRHARSALLKSCVQGGLHLNAFPKDENGVPLPVDGIYWSLSHKSDIVGGVAAPLPVGLDLETVRPVSDALMTKVADDDEWQLVGGKAKETFFRLWTAKEAVLKAVGKGITGLSRCRIVEILDETRMTLTYDSISWPVVHFRFDGHLAALTSHHFKVTWTF